MQLLDLIFDIDDISKFSKTAFKNLVKDKVRKYTFSSLLEDKSSQSKLKNLEYSEHKVQYYLVNRSIPLNNAIEVSKFRTRMSKFAKKTMGLQIFVQPVGSILIARKNWKTVKI